MANGQLEFLIVTIQLDFEVADYMLRENFVIIKTLPNPLIGLCFLRTTKTIFDVTQSILIFTYFQSNFNPTPKLRFDKQHLCLLKTPTDYNLYNLAGETLAIACRMPRGP